MAFSFDFVNQRINVSADQTVVDCQALYDAIVAAQNSPEGMAYPTIALASGKQVLSSGVAVGITVQLLDGWQLVFAPGSYTARVSGGNLIGALVDPVAYSAGVQVMLTLAAAATIVGIGCSIPTAAETAAAVEEQLAPQLAAIQAMTNLIPAGL